MRRYLASIISGSLGNILEWYDFGLFSIFSGLFSHLFFPTENKQVALIATFGIFAMGFICRPLGALIFGYMGDKTGRVKTLRLSILMISLPTLLIAFVPTYSQAGIISPIILMIIRMWQGISIGGEYSGNLVYLAESAPKNYRATFTSFAGSGANLGILLAALIGFITTLSFSTENLISWGWRVPYLLSGIFSLFILTYRLQLKETNVFNYLTKHKLTNRNPIAIVFKQNLPELLRTLGLVCMGSTFYFFTFAYLPLYLKNTLHYALDAISLLVLCLIVLMIIWIPLAGLICDRLGRRKMLLINATCIFLFVSPGFYFLQQGSYGVVLLVLFIFTLASSFEQGTTPIAVIENFPSPARYTGVALGYNLGNGFLGGTVPMISAWLNSFPNLKLLPALYVAGCALITGLVVYFFTPETEGKHLEE